MRCYRCGLESPLKEEFRRRPRFLSVPGISERWKAYCPPCWKRFNARVAWWETAVFLLLSAGGGVWLYWQPDGPAFWSLTFFWSFFFFLALGVAFHELGHFVCARLMGVRVFGVVVGRGSTLLKWKLANAVFEVKSVPLCGMVVCNHSELVWLRLKHWLLTLAGPVVAAAGLALVFALWHTRRSYGVPMPYSVLFASAWTLANLAILLGSLWPQRVNIGEYRDVPSDGLALLTIPFLSMEQRRGWHAYYFVQEASAAWAENRHADAQNWCKRGLDLYPADSALLMTLGNVQIRLGDFRSSRCHLADVLALKGLNPTVRPLLLDSIAWAGVMLGDSDLLPEADAYSAEACVAKPWMPEFLGTRGAVLVLKGDWQSGVDLLRIALEKNRDPYNRAVNACYLALGEARRGNIAAAKSYLEMASKLDPACSVLSRIRAEVSRAAENKNADRVHRHDDA